MDLRFPRITHLFEILSKKNSLLTNNNYPLTIGEARREILELLKPKPDGMVPEDKKKSQDN